MSMAEFVISSHMFEILIDLMTCGCKRINDYLSLSLSRARARTRAQRDLTIFKADVKFDLEAASCVGIQLKSVNTRVMAVAF